jgi:Mlc titration factor MtfA (ptsG expression regulator)
MFSWLTERRRHKLLEQPFPAEWNRHFEAIALWKRLDGAMQARLRDLVQVFVSEKHWEGCGGLELTGEIQVTIAALACVLLLGREHALYADVESILVYPTTMVSPPRKRMFFEVPGGTVDDGGTAIHGEAHLGGPVILAWDDVLDAAREHGTRNVVFHELAHKIDMLDGTIDGTPPLDSRAARARWASVCSEAFLELRARVDAGQHSFLRDYGATNEAEFFAVVTEAYFVQPVKLAHEEPALYKLLADFYRFELPGSG